MVVAVQTLPGRRCPPLNIFRAGAMTWPFCRRRCLPRVACTGVINRLPSGRPAACVFLCEHPSHGVTLEVRVEASGTCKKRSKTSHTTNTTHGWSRAFGKGGGRPRRSEKNKALEELLARDGGVIQGHSEYDEVGSAAMSRYAGREGSRRQWTTSEARGKSGTKIQHAQRIGKAAETLSSKPFPL